MFSNKKAQTVAIGIIAVVLVVALVIIFTNGGENEQGNQAPDGQSGQDQGTETGDNSNGGSQDSGSDSSGTGTNEDSETSSGQEHTVEMSSSGFTPQELTIDQGDTVTFENVGSSGIWPAVDRHPTHTQYDGTSTSEHCSDGAGPDTFDACRGVSPGETYEFTFDKTGEWTYHDHNAAYNTGTITVE